VVIKDGYWVDARILHKELGVGKKFTDWIKGKIKKYEFINGEDYKLTFTKTGERKNVKVNCYSLTLDMAKELSMVVNNKIGELMVIMLLLGGLSCALIIEY
jgi:anti-repressor protein